MANEQYIVIPGTQQRVYEGSVVMLYRLPNLRWIIHYGYYNYNGKKQKGWYFSSIPADTTMPVFNEDLVAMKVLDGSIDPEPFPPVPPPGPFPPGPGPFPPGPPAPIPIPFTPQDKKQLDAAMITVNDLAQRDKLGRPGLQDGKIVRVNDIDGAGKIEYYSWNAEANVWEEASLGYRYMTRDEIEEATGDDIVDIVWSSEDGALVLTNKAGTLLDPVELLGVAHDPIFTSEDLTLRIPIYGREDFTMTIPKDMYIRAIRFEPEWHWDDGHVGPAIVVTVSDGETEHELAGDASGLYNIYNGKETATATVIIESATGDVTADVKLSQMPGNVLRVDEQGLWVDLSGVVGKKEIHQGYLLVADGRGEFTYGGDGVELESEIPIGDIPDPQRKVVTANLIAAGISAAVEAISTDIDEKIDVISGRVDVIEEKVTEVVDITTWNEF